MFTPPDPSANELELGVVVRVVAVDDVVVDEAFRPASSGFDSEL